MILSRLSVLKVAELSMKGVCWNVARSQRQSTGEEGRKSHPPRGSATCSSLSNTDVLCDQKISHLCLVDRNVTDVQLTDPPLNIRRCQGLHITDKDMWLLGPYLLCQCVRRGASEGHKSQPKLGQVSLTSHFTLSLLTRVFHKLHFAKKKDAIPVRTPHGCI